MTPKFCHETTIVLVEDLELADEQALMDQNDCSEDSTQLVDILDGLYGVTSNVEGASVRHTITVRFVAVDRLDLEERLREAFTSEGERETYNYGERETYNYVGFDAPSGTRLDVSDMSADERVEHLMGLTHIAASEILTETVRISEPLDTLFDLLMYRLIVTEPVTWLDKMGIKCKASSVFLDHVPATEAITVMSSSYDIADMLLGSYDKASLREDIWSDNDAFEPVAEGVADSVDEGSGL